LTLPIEPVLPSRRAAGVLAAFGRTLVWLGALAVLGLVSGAVEALTISPVIVELSSAHKVVSITVTNPSDRAVSFQAEALAWSQPDGRDHYDETTDLMVVPPIAEIGAGKSQIFRVTSRLLPGSSEQAYRLILEDVTTETVVAPDSATVNIRVRHSLPVFVAGAGKAQVEAHLRPCSPPGSGGCVRLDNQGSHYLAIKSLAIDGNDWHKGVDVGTRVLAGAWREFRFDVPANSAGLLRVQADTSAGPFDGNIPAPVR
jgi:fimbrial chaperone protein